ncbi:MAG TPA: DUF1653 domain-containing protein [Lachnospiraceae bacterium]|nr:DUF1653 domain-containing protein [Lachnospiraceae bacterium]
MRERPKELEVYRHFKGKYYQVIAVARHTEYDEELVIYRPLFEQGEVYARPLSSFLSEVDKNAYPNARQKYRFTLASGENHGSGRKRDTKQDVEAGDSTGTADGTDTAVTADREGTGAFANKTGEEEGFFYDDYEDGGVLDPDLEAFLDERSFEKKLDILMFMRKKITDEMLNTIAVALDLRLNGDNPEDRYMEILDYLRTKKKYESDRLR